ncbi:MAG: hypothetical protein DMF28_01375 [Verrucomicrobia bacterium]|nr:MAG: hypothetical protein DMF28_01375 [Verrucomicrobiota bacterium]
MGEAWIPRKSNGVRMNRSWILSLGLVLAVTAIGAELVISSFNQNGELTWTNSITSNATYRVEWAGKATGPWRKFDALTNLTLLSATSSTVTATVPTFYRVVWLDPPQPEPQGAWDYKSYDQQSVLIVTGRLSMMIQTNRITGTWNLQRTGNPTRDGHFWLAIGTGELLGSLTGYDLLVGLNPRASDDNIVLQGRMIGTNWTGTWEYWGLSGVEPGGKVELVKQ